MKTKIVLLVALTLAVGGGVDWLAARHSSAATAETGVGARQPLYYTCSMHPWLREKKPGPCPICGMNLTPVYPNASGSPAETDAPSSSVAITLEPDSISAINVQTTLVERRALRHTLHLAGEIVGNSWTAAWFEFTAYERDLPWLKMDQAFDVIVLSAPGRVYHAQIKLHGARPFADADFDMMSGSTKVRAEILNPPVESGDLGKQKLFNGLHAEAHVAVETEAVLAVPRGAVISRGLGPVVYLDQGDGHYAQRAVSLGRAGDDYVEVLGGLTAGDKVVTTGNVLIDSEAQLNTGQ